MVGLGQQVDGRRRDLLVVLLAQLALLLLLHSDDPKVQLAHEVLLDLPAVGIVRQELVGGRAVGLVGHARGLFLEAKHHWIGCFCKALWLVVK